MRTKMIQVFPETALERILEALERELVEATDEEVLAAAHDLGMKPQMKGSAAFLGLRYPTVRLSAEDLLTIAAARTALRLLDLRGQPGRGPEAPAGRALPPGQAARTEPPPSRPTRRRPPVKSSRDED